MLPVVVKFEIFPSVFPTMCESELVICARERALIPDDGEEFSVTVVAVDGEHIADSTAQYTVTAFGGVIRLKHLFLDEQEYRVVLAKDEKTLFETSVFSVCDDLYELVPLMGDLHSHSLRSDGRQDPLALAGYMREQGYDFFAMTDHHRYYPSEEARECFDGIECGLVPILGEEVHAPGTPLHVVHIGGRASVNEQYVNRREEYDAEILEYEAKVPSDIPDEYRGRYARALWASEHIRAVGGLAILAHPFWRPRGSKRHNVSTEFATIAIRSGLFDAYEIVGAMGQQEVNASVAFWSDLRQEGLRIPVVGSSDVHSVENNPEFPWQRTVLFAKEKKHDAIIEAVKRGRCVAVEVTGVDYQTQYRAYGTMRLVNYAQFLLRYYFPKIRRLAFGEGVAMRAYAMGEAGAQLVELQARAARKFTARFFGKEAAPTPSAELLENAAKWNAIHKNYIV